jgi:8-oxo-dGTP pyrophosphatase MutT (NUDIX family)
MRSQRDSTSIVLTTTSGDVLLQLRDDHAAIENPGCYGLISGWVELGEDPLTAIKREILEEIRTKDGDRIACGQITFLSCDDRIDRPWTEYVFHAALLTSPDRLQTCEGKKLEVFGLDKCSTLENLAPHHRRYVDQHRFWLEKNAIIIKDRSGCYEKEELTMSAVLEMSAIEDYIELSELGSIKDYPALEVGDGFVVTSTTYPKAAIHTQADAKFIALLEFVHNVPRGNHYHLRKVEHMIVLHGRLLCSFAMPNDPKTTIERILKPGQMVRILPGCVHTYTALDGNVFALEYAPQRYEASDVIVVE